MKKNYQKQLFYLSCTTILMTVYNVSHAQKIGVDSKGESIFTYYSTDSRISLNAEGNLTYSQIFKKDSIPFFRVKHKDGQEILDYNDTTIVKLKGWNIEGTLSTDEELFSFSKPSTFRPGIGIRLGRQVFVDTFRYLETKLPTSKQSVKAYGINLLFKFDNIKYFNSISGKESNEYPVTIGLEGNYNFIFKNSDTLKKSRKVLAFTLSAINTWNKEELKSYQDLKDVSILPTIVALEEFKGRFGLLNRNVKRVRFSTAYAMYFGQFNLIPYAVINYSSTIKDYYQVGIFNNFLSKPLNPRLFKIPSTLGVGIELGYKEKEFKPAFFIKGELSLGEL